MKKIFLGLVIFAVLAALYGSYSFYRYYQPNDLPTQTLIIPPGTGSRGAVALLKVQGLVPSLPEMIVPLVLSGHLHALKAGEYEFAGGSSPAQVIAKIARGEIVVHKVTIPEGWTSYQIKTALMAEPLLTGEVGQLPEGSILPDTIHFQRGEARAAVIARMQKAQQELLAKLWATRTVDAMIATPEQALILASIVERETGVDAERGPVAGVFINRLHEGMYLQTDPTVIYGLEQLQGGAPLGRLLTHADLERDTIYNTYTRPGLPPAPICHPGKASIEAALRPAATDALYFVATGSGGHRFAATLKEHEANVAAYRAVMKEKK